MTVSTYDTSVMALAGQHIEKVGRDLRSPSFLVRFVASPVRLLLLWWLKKQSDKCTENAIFFKGVSRRFLEMDADADGVLATWLPKIDELKTLVLTLREGSLGLHQKVGGDNSELAVACANLLAAQSDLFEALEDFRWTLLELEANHSRRTEGYTATTPDAVDAMFERMHND